MKNTKFQTMFLRWQPHYEKKMGNSIYYSPSFVFIFSMLFANLVLCKNIRKLKRKTKSALQFTQHTHVYWWDMNSVM